MFRHPFVSRVPYRSVRRIKKLTVFGIVASLLFSLSTMFFPRPRKDYGFQIYLPDGDTTELSKAAYQNGWIGFPELSKANCKVLLRNSTKNSLFPKSLPRTAATQFALESRDCPSFLNKYGFQRYPEATEEERDFPLAYIILFHKDLDQCKVEPSDDWLFLVGLKPGQRFVRAAIDVLFLLRAIYRSHNVYCLSVDLNAGELFINAVKSVASCFSNVFVAKKLERIVYAGFSRFMADIHCMRELVEHDIRWKYLHNLPGQEFPLRTNLELVKILKIYNGANDIQGMTGKRLLPRRFRVKHHEVVDKGTGRTVIAEAVGRNPPPPHKFRIVKGSAYGSFSRAFVEFVLTDPKVQDLIEWSRDIESPDEYVFPTLHFTHVMDVPGGYKGVPDEKRYLAVYAAWEKESPCASMFVRWICILSTADLPMIVEQQSLFANKFYIDHHPATLHCLDQLIYNLTVTQTVRDLSYYQSLPWIIPQSPSMY